MSAQILIDVSDIHCGSVVGLAPPKTKTDSGNEISFGENLHQAWLWECWQEMVKNVGKIIGKSEAVLLVNGDATEGVHHHCEAELLVAAIQTHTEMAIECLKPLAALCKHRLVVKGTECHTDGMEDLLAEKLCASGNKARNEWLFEMNGCLVEAKHHMGVTSRAYLEASAMSIQMGNARINRVRANQRIPKVFLRGHRHCGGWFCDGSGLWGVTGGWQMLTRHGHKVVPESIPSPTALVLDWRGKAAGELPQVHELKFTIAQPEVLAL
jgi:hypothetical protein